MQTSPSPQPRWPPGSPRRSSAASKNSRRTAYFLRLLICLAALLDLRIAAIYAAKIDLVLDEAQY
jgi:hypothetical protein